jgi:hypothetical protein
MRASNYADERRQALPLIREPGLEKCRKKQSDFAQEKMGFCMLRAFALALFLILTMRTGYSQGGDSYQGLTYGHSNAVGSGPFFGGKAQTNVLRITAFHGGGAAYQYFVSETGRITWFRDVYSLAIQGGGEGNLSTTKLAILHSSLHALASEANSAPVTNELTLVSFRDGTNWLTRKFEADALPQSMVKVYEIIGGDRRRAP